MTVTSRLHIVIYALMWRASIWHPYCAGAQAVTPEVTDVYKFQPGGQVPTGRVESHHAAVKHGRTRARACDRPSAGDGRRESGSRGPLEVAVSVETQDPVPDPNPIGAQCGLYEES